MTFAESKNRIGAIVESLFSNLCSKIPESERNEELEMRKRKWTINYPKIHYSDKLVSPTVLEHLVSFWNWVSLQSIKSVQWISDQFLAIKHTHSYKWPPFALSPDTSNSDWCQWEPCAVFVGTEVWNF